jgi:GNAT superfamily N-acetyltransferase
MAPIRVGERWQIDPRKLSLRPLDGTADDLAALARVRNETVQATTPAEDFAAMSAEEVAQFYSGGDFELAGNAWLVFHDREPVAAAVVYPMIAFHDRPPGNFHLYVVPALWGHGLGSRLLAHLEQAAAERGHPVLETTVAAEDGPSTRFLREHGFEVVGRSIRLARNLPGDELSPEFPQGFEVRSLRDLGERPELYLETANRLAAYDPHYSLITPEEIDRQIATNRWDPAGALLLFDRVGRIVGVIRASREGRRGYLHEVRLEPGSRGKGLGTGMVASALRHLAGEDVERVELDTPGENAAAHRLALRAGFEEARHWLHFLKRLNDGLRSHSV